MGRNSQLRGQPFAELNKKVGEFPVPEPKVAVRRAREGDFDIRCEAAFQFFLEARDNSKDRSVLNVAGGIKRILWGIGSWTSGG